MVRLKYLKLKDYCGFRDCSFSFVDENGKIKPLAALFGFNGIGKSTCLYAIDMLSSSMRFLGRDNDLLFRKCTYHPDYNPTLAGFVKHSNKMEITGIYDTEDGDKKVVISTDGVIVNELPPKNKWPSTYSYMIDADNPINLHKFQLGEKSAPPFLKMAEEVYGYRCEIGELVNDIDDTKSFFYVNFIIHKNGTDKIHYKNMSAGEKKIAQLLSGLCNSEWMSSIDIVLVDNLEMHVHFSRHARLVKNILDMYPEKQFIITTHSPILVGMKDDKLGIDIPPFLAQQSLYDLEKYKKDLVQTSDNIT